MKTNELKACPFCNGTNLRTTDDVEGRPRYRAVYCFDCNARWYTNTDGSFDHWNTRPIEDGLQAEIEELIILGDAFVFAVEDTDRNEAFKKALSKWNEVVIRIRKEREE